jgi:hypothetical protein
VSCRYCAFENHPSNTLCLNCDKPPASLPEYHKPPAVLPVYPHKPFGSLFGSYPYKPAEHIKPLPGHPYKPSVFGSVGLLAPGAVSKSRCDQCGSALKLSIYTRLPEDCECLSILSETLLSPCSFCDKKVEAGERERHARECV